ncbi:MAG: phosphoribosyltransferase family protein [Patescibacteria group bacterium]|nr:phosphoribosyltransferase family protein [Patescibacteria group bacterium]
MSWDEFDKEMRALAQKIEYIPDIIVGVVRGGLVPARLLSTLLKVPKMRCVTLERAGERKILDELQGDFTGKKVLVVEDMIETGKGLVAARKYLESKGASVKTACLYTMPISETTPDYFLREVSEVIKFPWD